MVDDEAQRIREEVIRALEKQEAGELSLVDIPAAGEAPNEVGALEETTLKGDEAIDAIDEAQAERDTLRAVFDDVRTQSAASALVEPTRWPLVGLVPPHQTPDEWEMFVYEYVEESAARRVTAVAEITSVPRSATRAVGVPRMLRPREEEDVAEAAGAADEPTVAASQAEPIAPEAPQAPAASADAFLNPPCDDIVALVGKHSYYLYSNERMTDAYARWSFLAAEDDRMLTFVECVRDESRKYPRPMGAAALTNEPFNLQPAEVAELWEAIHESGAHPDIDTVTASNGDVYYFSTDYLSPTYAASLAEWNSVERDMFL